MFVKKHTGVILEFEKAEKWNRVIVTIPALPVQKRKTTEHTKTERQVLETIRQSPFLVSMHYAFQTPSKLHLVLDYVNGGELFTHLYQREKFTENEVRIYIGEIVLALEHLHKVSALWSLPNL